MTLNCLPQLNVTALILMITRHNFYFHTEAYALKFEKKQFVQIRNEIWPDCALKEESESGTNAGIKDLKYFKYLFEVELSTPKHKFTFLHVSYPFLPIYASGTVSFEPVDYNVTIRNKPA